MQEHPGLKERRQIIKVIRGGEWRRGCRSVCPHTHTHTQSLDYVLKEVERKEEGTR